MIEKYESKQVQVRRGAQEIYAVLADFNNFTPLVEGRVDDWRVAGDECSFNTHGFSITLRMVEKVAGETIKVVSGGSAPLGVTLWVQLRQMDEPLDTRLRLTLHADMNFIVKAMIGKKIQPALDGMADTIAAAFNTFA